MTNMLRKNCLEAILNPAPAVLERGTLASQEGFRRVEIYAEGPSMVQKQAETLQNMPLKKEMGDYLPINSKLSRASVGDYNFSSPSVPPLPIRRLPVKREADHAEHSRQHHTHTVSAPNSDEATGYNEFRSETPIQEGRSMSQCSSSTSLADEDEDISNPRWTSSQTSIGSVTSDASAPYSSPPLPDDDSSADEVVDSRNVITCHFGSCTAVINTLHSPLGYHLNDCHKPSAQDRNGNIACQWDSCGIQVKWRNLRRHIMESHLGSLSKECSGCGKIFSRSDALKRHQKHYCGGKKVPAQAGLGSEGPRFYPRPMLAKELLEPIPPTGRSVGRGRGRTPPRQRPYPSPTISSTSGPYPHQDQRNFSGAQYPGSSSPPHRMIPPQDRHQHHHHHNHDNGRLQVLSSCSTSYERYPSATPDYPPRPTSRPVHDRYQPPSHHYPHPHPSFDPGNTSRLTDRQWHDRVEREERERRT